MEDAHLPAQHVNELRQGIDSRVAKELAHPRDLPIPPASRLLMLSGPEIKQLEPTPAASDAQLLLQYGAVAFPFNGQSNEKQ